MPHDARPAFQFYPRDWLTDPGVIVMDCAGRGAYINLLSVCWLEGNLPRDERVLARLAGAHPNEWKRIRADVLACFQERDGCYYQKRLDLERQKQDDFRAAASRAGHASAQRRLNDRATTVQQESNSSSSSSVRTPSEYVPTPIAPFKGGQRGGTTAGLTRAAKKLKKKLGPLSPTASGPWWESCPHEPVCDTLDACLLKRGRP